ncbi:MAG TPA: hypothetical protein PKI03_37845 [Pseudomonadota bacterium]|nr:hypothetical protein [Pseudomonadota bacterium]
MPSISSSLRSLWYVHGPHEQGTETMQIYPSICSGIVGRAFCVFSQAGGTQ